MVDDLIKFGAAALVGYLIADFLSPKRAYQGDIADQSGDQSSFRSNTLPTYVAKQGYVFGQGHGNQRHQWDFMPHSLPLRAYQGVLGVDYTLACSDQSIANSAGQCANGTRAVVSPISQPPPPVPAPAPATLVPTSTDSGLPATTPDSTTTSTTTTTQPTVTTVPVTTTPVTTTPVPVVTTTTTPVVTTPTPTPTPHPSNNPQYWQQWAQNFRNDLRQDLQQQFNRQGLGRGNEWGRGSGWAFQRGGREHHAYAGTTSQTTPQTAVLLATITPTGLHLDAHGLQPSEPVTVDLNIPLSNVSKTTNLMADSSGHVTHDYNMTKPPGKSYIAAIRVTGQQSKRVGFKSVKI